MPLGDEFKWLIKEEGGHNLRVNLWYFTQEYTHLAPEYSSHIAVCMRSLCKAFVIMCLLVSALSC